MAKPAYSPEIFIGIVGRIGTDRESVIRALKEVLAKVQYKPIHIHLTDQLKKFPNFGGGATTTFEGSVKAKIKACNDLRGASGSPAIMSLLALLEIEKERRLNAGLKPGDLPIPLNRVAYIIDQIKRPEESKRFREIYGGLYIQLSCHSPRDKRLEILSDKITKKRPGKNHKKEGAPDAIELIEQDDHEEQEELGQRVREVFPEADFVLDTESKTLRDDLERFLSTFFGNHTHSPTPDEYGMVLASTASQRSLSGARQVGAAILTKKHQVIALGCNEVPKPFGGSYWEDDDDDARDVTKGTDQNFEEKMGMMGEVLSLLSDNGHLSEDLCNLNQSELLDKLVKPKSAILSNTRVMDSLEFGRDLHAEMSALIEAARLGISTDGAVLYCNTFPCHNCTKHIVASGISRVVYLKPFDKSYAEDLFSDSISVDASDPSSKKVPFVQFTGVAPSRFGIFEKGKLGRDGFGKYDQWVAEEALPKVPPPDFHYFELERQVIQMSINALKDGLREEIEEIQSS